MSRKIFGAATGRAATPSGQVWMVDTKAWTGDVTLHHGVLRENGLNRCANVGKVRAAAVDAAATLGPGSPELVPVVCLTQSGSSLLPDLVDGVVVVGLEHLDEVIGAGSLQVRTMRPEPAPVGPHAKAQGSPSARTSPATVKPQLPDPPTERAGAGWMLFVVLLTVVVMAWVVFSSDGIWSMLGL